MRHHRKRVLVSAHAGNLRLAINGVGPSHAELLAICETKNEPTAFGLPVALSKSEQGGLQQRRCVSF